MNISSIENIIKLVSAAIKAYKAANADGKIDTQDLMLVYTLIPKIMPVVSTLDEIPEELLDLDQQEAEYLLKLVQTEFNLPSSGIEDEAGTILVSILRLFHNVYNIIDAVGDIREIREANKDE